MSRIGRMPMSRVHARIGLLDHLGHGNLGDDATLDAVMSNITNRWQGAVIIGFSLNPFDTQKRHGIPCYAIRRDSKLPPEAHKLASNTVGFKKRIKHLFSKCRRVLAILRAINTVVVTIPIVFYREFLFLLESFRLVKSLDLFVICGGGQLLDSWGGPWRFPYTLFKWVLLSKLSGIKCYFINVGSGPLTFPLSRLFIKYALFLSDYASFRDNDSQKLVQRLGFTRRTVVVADSVYSLDMPPVNITQIGTRHASVIGFSPMAYCDPRVYWDKNQIAYDCYIRKLAVFGSWLIQQHHRLSLFSTDIWFDSQAIEDLAVVLHNERELDAPQSLTRKHIETIEELLFAMSSMDYVITSRYHGVVFAHLMNIPVLAISHHPKVATLMSDVGLSEYCVDIRNPDVVALTNTFTKMVHNRNRIRSTMAEKAACYKASLSTQFDKLFYSKASGKPFRRCEHECV
jgi:polysaccharide pyruvyl transferase WcaK-like protein